MTVPGAAPIEIPGGSVSLATWVGFAAMCLGMFMAVLDIQVVATSLIDIRLALNFDPELMSWVQTSYLIAEIISIPLTGLLTRVLSMRGLFVIALSGFILASIGCAASGSFAAIIACRVVQGFAGGVLIPTVFTAVFLLFPVARQSVATSLAGALAMLAPTVGPIVGGWITDTYSWHWLFLINVGPGIAAVAVAASLLPRERPEFRHARHLDWISLALMAVALAALEILLKEAPKRGWTSGLALGLLLLCGLTGVAFIRRTLGRKQPLVDLTALADRNFALGCWFSFILGLGLYASVYLMPVFLGLVRTLEPFDIGKVMLVTGVAQLLAAPIAVEIEKRCDPRWLTAFGFALFAVGLGLSYFQTFETDFDQMFWPQIIRGVAIMFCLLPPTRLALGDMPPERVADASGLFNLMRNLGGAIGIALADTMIWARTPIHVDAIVQRLLAGDRATAIFVGLPTEKFIGQPMAPVDDATKEYVRPLVERAGLVTSINEAWALLGAITLLSLVVLGVVLFRTRQKKSAPELPRTRSI